MKRCDKLTTKQKEQLQSIINNSKSSGLEVRRAQAVLLLDAQTNIEAIIALTNYSRRQIFDLRKNYLKAGITVIQDKKKGKPKELLTKNQLAEIVKIIKEKTPKDYGYQTAFWTTGIVGAIIESEYNVKYKSKTSIYLIFKQAKFSYHKPDRLYQARNEQEVREWKKEAKEKVERALSEKDTIILVADEMSLSTPHHSESLAATRRIP